MTIVNSQIHGILLNKIYWDTDRYYYPIEGTNLTLLFTSKVMSTLIRTKKTIELATKVLFFAQVKAHLLAEQTWRR